MTSAPALGYRGRSLGSINGKDVGTTFAAKITRRTAKALLLNLTTLHPRVPI
jgi:hypothetical protein